MTDILYNLRLLWENVVPRRCAVCNTIIHDGAFCSRCRADFALHKMVEDGNEFNLLYFLFKYKDELRDLIRALKFQNCTRYIPYLREEAFLAMGTGWSDFLQQYDYVTWIPTSTDRREERQFELAEKIFTFLPQEKLKSVLVRTRKTAPLFSMNREERQKELAGCFAIKTDVRDKRILLVDDIYTTGSTGREAARTLHKGGAKYVDMLGFSASKDNWD